MTIEQTYAARRTTGEWRRAADSYGKVQHSRKACVYTIVTNPTTGAERIVTVASRIENWADASLIEQAPTLLTLLKEVAQPLGLSERDFLAWLPRALAAIEAAER